MPQKIPTVESQGHHGSTYIAGDGQHPGEIDAALRMNVAHPPIANAHRTCACIEHAVRRHHTGVKGCCHHQRLEHRAEFIGVGYGPIAIGLGIQMIALIGIEGRLIDHGPDLTCTGLYGHQ